MKKFKNILKKQNLCKILILCVLFFTYIILETYFYVNIVSNDLKNNIFRLHVIANSNSKEDQNLKFLIRDNIIDYINILCKDSKSKSETVQTIQNHKKDFEKIANNIIKENGFSYNATIEIGNFLFPTKNYADISFPSGYYDALKIKLGNANGENWWCVLYPSLCFIDSKTPFLSEDSKEKLQNDLSSEEYALISNSKNNILNLKFKLIELFSK